MSASNHYALMAPKRTGQTGVIWLNGDRFDLASLNDNRVSFASVCAKQGSSREFNIEGTSEVSSGISKESNAAGLLLVEGFAPGVHAVQH